jgi:uncharacterized protein (DUF1015 family)
MADVSGFPGIRYDPAVVDLAAVTAPPYDVISPAELDRLEAASPYNIVRLILGRDLAGDDAANSKYTRARDLLVAWLREGVLVRDETPSLYVYEEGFSIDGKRRRQIGALAAVTLSDEILPHEHTMAPIVSDRLAVIRATRANLSPVFCLYWNAGEAAASAIEEGAKGKPYADFGVGDGTTHRAWRLDDPDAIDAYAAALRDATVVIADGHHRYQTAMAYRDERRAADGPGPWDRMLLYLVDATRDAPALLPIHRLVSGIVVEDALARLRETFAVVEATADPAALARLVAETRAGGARSYGILGRGEAWLTTLIDEKAAEAVMPPERSAAWRNLDVAVLHELVFARLLGNPPVTYVHSAPEAAETVERGHASFAVLLAPTPVDAVRAVAEAREAMPPKSTFFVPKARSGIVVRSLEP